MKKTKTAQSKLPTVREYNNSQTVAMKKVCEFLALHINKNLKNSESKIWHRSPVWFIAGNPVVSYTVRKSIEKGARVSLMFFSGQSFGEADLIPGGSFKAAEIFYTDTKEIKIAYLKRWLQKAKKIQWDYKDIVKRKGVLKKIV